MKMLSRVCVDFQDTKGNVIFRIRPADRLRYIDDAPDAIRDDLLFKMLVAEGSIEVVESAAQRKALEQDPTAGALADGRKIVAASGGSHDDFEVTRNERSVRGTVATIEGAERKASKVKDEKKADEKPDEKSAEGEKK